MRQHPGAAAGRHRLGVPCQHIAFIKNLAQRIVRRQALQECLPSRQLGGNRYKKLQVRGRLRPQALQRVQPTRRGQALDTCGIAPRAQMPGKSHQRGIVYVEQGRLECLCQRQIVAGRYQCIHQREQVLHLGHLGELAFFYLLGGHTQTSQRLLHGAQQRALARQHHHILRLEAPRRVLQRGSDPARGLRALHHFAVFFGLVARALQRVAPLRCGLRIGGAGVARLTGYGRQGQHLSSGL